MFVAQHGRSGAASQEIEIDAAVGPRHMTAHRTL